MRRALEIVAANPLLWLWTSLLLNLVTVLNCWSTLLR